MAVTTPKKMYRGAASLTNTTLYTVPASTQAVMTKLHVANTSSSAQTFTINLNGTAIYSGATIAANSGFTLDTAEVLAAAETISGSASATSVNFSINGVETV